MDRLMKNIINTTCSGFLLLCSGLSVAGTVNINNANVDEIAESMHGVGMRKATLVVEYREQHGAFASIEALSMVKGIGAKTIELNRDNISID